MFLLDLSNVRVKEHFGIVTNDTSTVQFSFLLSPMKNRAASEKDGYVILDHPALGDMCPVLAIVKEIKSYEEIAGSTLSERIGKMAAIAEVVGYVDLRNEDRPLRRLLVPPNPGSRVYMPYSEFLEDTFSRDPQGKKFKQALYMGKIESYATSTKDKMKPINFYLNADDFINRHTLIAGMDGAGKTHTATVIVEELANKTGYPTIIFDPFSEYGSVGTPRKDVTLTNENGEPLSKAYPFNFSVSSLTNVKAEPETKDTLLKNIKANHVTILNSKRSSPDERRKLFEYCLEALWKGRREQTIPSLLAVIENADALKSEVIEKLAQEGIKTGISLCLLSTHPTELGDKTLAYISNFLIGKMTDEKDLDYLKNATNSAIQPPQLVLGEWIIYGIGIRRPTRVNVRDKYSMQ